MYNILVAINNFDSPLAIRTMEEAVSLFRGQNEECLITLLHVKGADSTNAAMSMPLPIQAQTAMMYPYPLSVPVAGSAQTNPNGIPDEYADLGAESDEEDEVIAHAGEWLKEKGVRYETVSMSGDPASEIFQYAEDHAIDMIVMGRQDKGALERIFIGSVSKKVVESSPVSVLVVK